MSADTTNNITKDFLLSAAKRFPDAFLWRNNRIRAKAIGRDGKARIVDAGIDGQGDITGCIPIMVNGQKLGIRCEIEVKAGADTQNANQINFEHAVRRAGGIYLIIHDADKGIAELESVLKSLI